MIKTKQTCAVFFKRGEISVLKSGTKQTKPHNKTRSRKNAPCDLPKSSGANIQNIIEKVVSKANGKYRPEKIALFCRIILPSNKQNKAAASHKTGEKKAKTSELVSIKGKALWLSNRNGSAACNCKIQFDIERGFDKCCQTGDKPPSAVSLSNL